MNEYNARKRAMANEKERFEEGINREVTQANQKTKTYNLWQRQEMI